MKGTKVKIENALIA